MVCRRSRGASWKKKGKGWEGKKRSFVKKIGWGMMSEKQRGGGWGGGRGRPESMGGIFINSYCLFGRKKCHKRAGNPLLSDQWPSQRSVKDQAMSARKI